MALRIIAITLACVTSARICAGELSAQDGVPAFEVVAVKPNASGDTNSTSIVQPGAHYTATNATLRMLIKTAYQVHDDQIVFNSRCTARLGTFRSMR